LVHRGGNRRLICQQLHRQRNQIVEIDGVGPAQRGMCTPK
jgi:hypothetical protein